MNLRVIALACGVVALLWGAQGVAGDSVGVVPIPNVRLGMSVQELKAVRPGARVWELNIFPDDDDRENEKPTEKKAAEGKSAQGKPARELLTETPANHELFSSFRYMFEGGHLVLVNLASDRKPEHFQRKRRAFYELLFAKYGPKPEQRVVFHPASAFQYYAPFLLWKRGRVMMYAVAMPDFRQIVSREESYFLVVGTTEAIKLAELFQFCDVDAEQMQDVFRRAGLPLETPPARDASKTQK